MNWAKIEQLRKLKKISQEVLAKQSEISESGYKAFIKRKKGDIETIEKIAKGLGVSPAVFFDDEIIIDLSTISEGAIGCPFCKEKERVIKILEENNEALRNSIEVIKEKKK